MAAMISAFSGLAAAIRAHWLRSALAIARMNSRMAASGSFPCWLFISTHRTHFSAWARGFSKGLLARSAWPNVDCVGVISEYVFIMPLLVFQQTAQPVLAVAIVI